ncbi:MAG: hypothetical protein IPQ02_05315 [Saprospiraceae bacterium]|uniref:Uncharacterized protein n=1 Tax=Candidatus Defluviibacterium haderslevense TaxID=2981993 RepID=A0A9D7S6J7_9BACT|nr:hypothetical protein [Candidatus Defluviibacterium haderslevense]MBL0236037.1 hypothetical protein [Candidatus Defluviibacterium haderslevense]
MENELSPFIKVILIDDQPETLIGVNGFPEVINDSDNGDERFVDIEKYFQVKWLQNMNDIKEYRNLCHEAEDLYGTSFIGEKGWVPEIVCFDYALSPGKNENTGIPEHIKQSNPNLLLIEHSQKYKRLARSYSDKEKNEIKAPKIREAIEHLQLSNPDFKDLNNTEKLKQAEEFLKENRQLPFYEPIVRSVNGKDNMGCFGGGLIVSQFRKHPCVGIPTTSKEAASIEGNEAEFFEWLIEDDLNNTFFHGVKTQRWTMLLPKAVENLRFKIKSLVSGNKITLALGHLMQLANGKIPEKDNEQIFTFYSDFGKHSLPLKGLFIDVAIENRNVEIKNFCSELLNQLIENTKAGMNVSILRNAYDFADSLITEYKNEEKFFDRINYSFLKQRLEMGLISTEQKKTFNNLLTKYFMTGVEDKYKDFFDIRSKDFGKDDAITKRYTVLFTMLNIYKIFQDFKLENAEKNEFKKQAYLFNEPEEYDYLLGIFPRAETPAILHIHHAYNKQTLDKALKDKVGFILSDVLKAKNENRAIKEEEKTLLQSYALGIELSKPYPIWIQ